MKSVHLLLYYLDDTQLWDKLVCFLNFILSGFVGVTCTESAMLNVTKFGSVIRIPRRRFILFGNFVSNSSPFLRFCL